MIYPSEVKKLREDAELTEKAKLYLEAKSIEEYIIERDTRFQSSRNYSDLFVWWYIYKERLDAFIAWVLLIAIINLSGWLCLSICLNWTLWLIIPIAIVIPICYILGIIMFCQIASAFGNCTIKRDVNEYPKHFKELDENYSQKLTK